jgi:hypothetical protein
MRWHEIISEGHEWVNPRQAKFAIGEIVESVSWPKETTPDVLIHWLDNNHHSPEDLDYGDLNERVWAFQRYTLQRVPLSTLNAHEWYVDDDMVRDYAFSLNRSPAPPIIYDPVNKSIIDGTHRVNAASEMGESEILAYVGDPSTYEQPDEIED